MSIVSARRRALPAALFVTALISAAGSAAEPDAAALSRSKLDNPQGGVYVVAHRGCHTPSPAHDLAEAPENSRLALEHCIALGVDMMETDVRRTKDGVLVIMHDATIDRTTSGKGRLADLTLAEVRNLRLRQNFGGAMSPTITDQTVLTLDELLAAAKGRIMLNLDIKEAIYTEVIAAAARAGSADHVLVKTIVSEEDGALADQAPYRDVSYMPIIEGQSETHRGAPGTLAARQAGAHRRIPAVELLYLTADEFASVREVAQKTNIRLWANTLSSVGVTSVIGGGGDLDALRDPDRGTWRDLIKAGVSAFQTDEPAALIDYLVKTGRR